MVGPLRSLKDGHGAFAGSIARPAGRKPVSGQLRLAVWRHGSVRQSTRSAASRMARRSCMNALRRAVWLPDRSP